jgi:hypothetical protein
MAQWYVDPDPDLVIGAFEGPEPYVLFNVIDAVSLSDGTVVIGMFDRTAFELRYFDGDGSFLASAGRWGEGPFESSTGFNSLEPLAGDSLLIVSLDLRYSVFGPRGERVRSGRLDLSSSTLMRPWNLVDDGHLLFSSIGPPSEQAGRDHSDVPNLLFSVLDLDTGESVSIADLPAERIPRDEKGAFIYLPFRAQPGWAAGAGRVWLGHGQDRVITGWAGDGTESTEVFLSRPGHAVTREDRDRWTDPWGRKPSVEFPDSLPFFQQLRTDTDGNLWVQEYEPPWSEEDYHWDVFDAQGQQIARVTMPFIVLGSHLRADRFRGQSPLLEIGPDHVLVKAEDAVGSPVVKKHVLVKERDP